MQNKNYAIDLKFYATVPQDEVGLRIPIERMVNGNIPIGIHQLIWEDASEHDLDMFMEKTFTNPDIKILGVHSVNI